jgi:hypothetical protein
VRVKHVGIVGIREKSVNDRCCCGVWWAGVFFLELKRRIVSRSMGFALE